MRAKNALPIVSNDVVGTHVLLVDSSINQFWRADAVASKTTEL